MDCYTSRATSQNFMKELAQSDLLILSYGSGCITTKKIKVFFSNNTKIVSQIGLIPSPVLKFCDTALDA